jgi:hypothetical protein
MVIRKAENWFQKEPQLSQANVDLRVQMSHFSANTQTMTNTHN